MSALWKVLGAGSILPRAGYGSSGYALRPSERAPWTLFDCGPGTLRALGEAGIAVGEVERVVLSHFHPDHCWDVFALAFARRNPNLAGLGALEIVGPRGLAAWLERGGAVYGARGWTRFEGTRVEEVEPAEPGRLAREGLALSWSATGHTPEALAWRADLEGGAAVAYSGDTGENADVAALARGVDLFACECSFPDDAAVAHHLTPSSAARLAREAGCRRLLLTHFYPELDPEEARAVAARTFEGEIELARDQSEHAL